MAPPFHAISRVHGSDPRLVQHDPPRPRLARLASRRAMPMRLAYRYLARSIDANHGFLTSEGYDHVIPSHPPLVGVQGDEQDNNEHAWEGGAQEMLLETDIGMEETCKTRVWQTNWIARTSPCIQMEESGPNCASLHGSM